MRVFRNSTFVLLALVLGISWSWAANSCQEVPDEAGPPDCGPGSALFHGGSGSPDSGGFDLAGTQYANTCATGTGGCTIDIPELRYWQWSSWLNLLPVCTRNENAEQGQRTTQYCT